MRATESLMSDLTAYATQMARRARDASRRLAVTPTAQKNHWLRRSADRLRAAADDLIVANARDLTLAAEYGLTSAQIDRLTLNPARIESVAQALEEVAALPDPPSSQRRTTFSSARSYTAWRAAAGVHLSALSMIVFRSDGPFSVR